MAEAREAAQRAEQAARSEKETQGRAAAELRERLRRCDEELRRVQAELQASNQRMHDVCISFALFGTVCHWYFFHINASIFCK